MLPCIFRGRHPHLFMKYLGKVETVFKSNGFCNIDHRHFVMRQQITCLLDAILTQIFFRGLVQYRLKCPAQIAAAQPDICCHVIHGNGRTVIGRNVLNGFYDITFLTAQFVLIVKTHPLHKNAHRSPGVLFFHVILLCCIPLLISKSTTHLYDPSYST